MNEEKEPSTVNMSEYRVCQTRGHEPMDGDIVYRTSSIRKCKWCGIRFHSETITFVVEDGWDDE